MVSDLAGTEMLPGEYQIGQAVLCDCHSSAQCDRCIDDGTCLEQHHPGYSGQTGSSEATRATLGVTGSALETSATKVTTSPGRGKGLLVESVISGARGTTCMTTGSLLLAWFVPSPEYMAVMGSLPMIDSSKGSTAVPPETGNSPVAGPN